MSDDNEKELVSANLKAKTALGKEFQRQWKAALQTRRTEQVGDYSLAKLLVECHAARDDKTTCAEQQLRDEYPEWASMPVSIVAFKVGLLVSLIRESLVDVAAAPFIIDPTPSPDIPKAEKDRIIEELSAEVMEVTASLREQGMMLDDKDIIKLIKSKKVEAKLAVEEHAKAEAHNLQTEIYDKTIEGGYRNAVIEFADDFATYPFGCIHGPYPIIREESVWRGSKFVEEKKVVWAFERISPFDLFWTEDSKDTQGGTAVFVRKTVGYNYLFDARELARDESKKRKEAEDAGKTPEEGSGYIEANITELIDLTREAKIPRQWTEFDMASPESNHNPVMWQQGDTIEMLIRYGRFYGHTLKDMGFTGLDEDRAYETMVTMVGGKVIQCQLNKNPSQYKRPVFTASFEKRNGSIAGVGLAQRLLGIHKAFRAVVNLAMYNLGLSAEPITEIEADRILKYMPAEWIDDPTISPGQVFVADPDRASNGSRAIKFTEIPNVTTSSISMAQYIFDMAHVLSNIPAALHGQPVGSGANRTVRGLLTLQGNTLKPIHSSLVNLDMGVIEPMVTLLYMLLVIHEDGFDYSGDAKIIAKGAASMIQREIDKQAAMENIQILGQLGDQVNPTLMDRAITKLLSLSGIMEPGEVATIQSQMQAAPPEQAPQPPAQPTAPEGGADPMA